MNQMPKSPPSEHDSTQSVEGPLKSHAINLFAARDAELLASRCNRFDAGAADSAADAEVAWISVANRRYYALTSGADDGHSHEEVFSGLRQSAIERSQP